MTYHASCTAADTVDAAEQLESREPEEDELLIVFAQPSPARQLIMRIALTGPATIVCYPAALLSTFRAGISSSLVVFVGTHNSG